MAILKNEIDKAERHASKNEYAEALDILDRLAEAYPREACVWAKRGHVNRCCGNYEAASLNLTKAISICDSEPHNFFMRGLDFLALNRLNEALKDFTRVIELCDQYQSDYYRSAAYLCRADVHLRLGLFDNAIADCAHVPNDNPLWTDRLRKRSDIIRECRK